MSQDFNSFKKAILNLKGHRIHSNTNSFGVYDVYKWLRKNKWLNLERPVTEHEFYQIVRKMNTYLAEELAQGNDIKLPNRMGRLELRKRDATPKIDSNGKVKITYSIDWDKTLKLWYEDKQAFNKKMLVRIPDTTIFRMIYTKSSANYNNKNFMELKFNRALKNKLKQNIKNNKIDAFNLW